MTTIFFSIDVFLTFAASLFFFFFPTCMSSFFWLQTSTFHPFTHWSGSILCGSGFEILVVSSLKLSITKILQLSIASSTIFHSIRLPRQNTHYVASCTALSLLSLLPLFLVMDTLAIELSGFVVFLACYGVFLSVVVIAGLCSSRFPFSSHPCQQPPLVRLPVLLWSVLSFMYLSYWYTGRFLFRVLFLCLASFHWEGEIGIVRWVEKLQLQICWFSVLLGNIYFHESCREGAQFS